MIKEKTAIRTTPMSTLTTLSPVSAENILRRPVWVCDCCGMQHLSSAPQNCSSCGSATISVTHDLHATLGPSF